MTQLIRVTAKFVHKATGKPVTGEAYRVEVYDKDVVSDDCLGKGTLNADGVFELLTDLDKAVSSDSPGETRPDLMFLLFNEHGVIYQSEVFRNIEFLERDDVSGGRSGLTHDFGPFQVEE